MCRLEMTTHEHNSVTLLPLDNVTKLASYSIMYTKTSILWFLYTKNEFFTYELSTEGIGIFLGRNVLVTFIVRNMEKELALSLYKI